MHVIYKFLQKCCALMLCAVPAAAFPALAQPPQHAQTIIALDANSEPVVTYIFGTKTKELSLSKRDTNPGLFTGVPAQGCELSHEPWSTTIKGCTRFSATVSKDHNSWSDKDPTKVALQNGGMLIYTDNVFAYEKRRGVAEGSDPSLLFLKAPPNGVVILEGQKSAIKLENSADLRKCNDFDRGAAYFGPDKFAPTTDAHILVDDGIATEIAAFGTEGVVSLVRYFAKSFGKQSQCRPTVYFTWIDRVSDEKTKLIRARDGRPIHIDLKGAQWASPTKDDITQLKFSIAYHLALLWRASRQPMVPKYLIPTYQGNAELLGTAALLSLNLIDGKDAVNNVDLHIKSCMNNIEGQFIPWLRELTYACGFVEQFLMVAVAKKKHADMDVAKFWRSYRQKYGNRASNYEFPNFLQLHSNKEAARAHRKLQSEGYGKTLPPAPYAVRLESLLSYSALRYSFPEGTQQSTLPSGSLMMIRDFIKSDCEPSSAISVGPGGAFFQSLTTCRTFRPDYPNRSPLRTAQGISLYDDSLSAVAAVRAACKRGEAVVFKNRDNEEFAMPCSPEIAAKFLSYPPVVVLDAAQVAEILVSKVLH